jgi:23S rRNA pseudouridine1911/1915/1917 synthase
MNQGRNRNPELRAFNVNVEGARLDKFLAGACLDLSRSQIQKAIRDGLVTVNRVIERAAFRLKEGASVEILVRPATSQTLAPEDIEVQIVYEDQDVVIIDKPAGLTVYPAAGHPSHTLANALIHRFPDLAVFGDSQRPGIVHRLDKDTSGLMAVARNEGSLTYLTNAFKARSVRKSYTALVRGKITPNTGSIEAPIGRDPANRKRMAIVADGRQAKTDYRLIEHLRGCSLVEAFIRTGRTHQIRVHFAAIGHPVIGDTTYGVRSELVGRQFLHASSLELKLPSSDETRTFTSDLPADLQNALRDLRN